MARQTMKTKHTHLCVLFSEYGSSRRETRFVLQHSGQSAASSVVSVWNLRITRVGAASERMDRMSEGHRLCRKITAQQGNLDTMPQGYGIFKRPCLK